MEGVLQKLKKSLTGSYWKHHWVVASLEFDEFLQFNSASNPAALPQDTVPDATNDIEAESKIGKNRWKENPKYSFILSKCTVEESFDKKYSFTIIESSGSGSTRSMTFAADSFLSYEQWIRLLMYRTASQIPTSNLQSGTGEAEGGEEEGSVSSEDFTFMKSDAIADYFFQPEFSQTAADIMNPAIEADKVEPLLLKLDPSVNPRIVQSLLFQHLEIPIGGKISYEEFLLWYREHSYIFESDLIDALNQPPSHPAASSSSPSPSSSLHDAAMGCDWSGHMAGVFNSSATRKPRDIAIMSHCRVPKPKLYEDFHSTVLDAVTSIDDWDGLYQTLVEVASESSQKRNLEVSEYEDYKNHMYSVLDLLSLQHIFYKAATEGAKVIVDEYVLPEEHKSIHRVNLPRPESDDVDNASNDNAASNAETFEYAGLLFSVAAAPAREEDYNPNLTRVASATLTDELLRKIANNEMTATHSVQAAVEALLVEDTLTQRWRASQQMDASAGMSRLHVCLSTVVDYAGFRVSVMCPTEVIDEPTTLVNGFCERQQIFVDASPAARNSVRRIAKKLNLTYSSVPLPVLRTTLAEDEGTEVDISEAEMVSRELQVHTVYMTDLTSSGEEGAIAVEGSPYKQRLYMVNHASLAPMDLPRKDSLDPWTKRLRPEFCRLSGDPVSANPVKSMGEEREFSSFLSCVSLLYTLHIPNLASLLDSLCDLPFDSFSLTSLLHAYGVRVGQVGILYQLSRSAVVKQLLITEALARCCKTLINRKLRNISREMKSLSLRAERRRRSRHSDYRELAEAVSLRRKEAVVEIFNMLLGKSPHTNLFWTVSMSELLYQKFGIPLPPQEELNQILHLPQLFLAVLYHTNSCCKDCEHQLTRLPSAIPYNRGDPAANIAADEDIFTVEDFEGVCMANTSTSLTLPGEVGAVESLCEAYLLWNLLPEAVGAFKLRLHCQLLLLLRGAKESCPQLLRRLSDTMYKLALCYYRMGSFDLVSKTLRQHLSGKTVALTLGVSALTARMMTLLMCAEYHQDNMDNAKMYFDAGQQLYLYALGPSHPYLSIHLNALADCYVKSKRFSHAKVMVMLSQAVVRRCLGVQHVMSSLLECKLAYLLMAEGAFKPAVAKLSPALVVLEACMGGDVTSGGLSGEVLQCLYGLCLCFSRCGEVDLAIHSGFRCLELATKVFTQQQQQHSSTTAATAASRGGREAIRVGRPAPRRPVAMIVSTLLLLCDLYMKKKEVESAFEILQEAWTEIKNSYGGKVRAGGRGRAGYRTVAQSLCRVAVRVLEVIIFSLPLQTRSLFDSVSGEALNQIAQALVYPDPALKPGSPNPTRMLWEQAVTLTAESMWEMKPADYFSLIFQGIHATVAQKEGFLDQEEAAATSPPPLVPFEVQGAVISRLVSSAGQLSHSLLQN